MPKLRRALLSVSDKRGLVEFARGLAARGVELLSTGGTFKALADAGVAVRQVSDFTGAPEILDGRVKTLHPRVHGGILGRPTPAHEAEMKANGIEPIDLVCVNLYPFEATVAKPDVAFADAIENIDIGGPAMVRSSAKNHERVCVVVDPDDYADVLAELERGGGAVGDATRRRLATKAFAHTAAYDGAIAAYLSSIGDDPAYPAGHPSEAGPVRAEYPAIYGRQWHRLGEPLRYGENPHQTAAFYADASAPAGPSIARAAVLQGKQLSYNNILDCDAALGLSLDLPGASCVIIKHTNPCGAASAASCLEAYRQARATDPTSAFGGIVAVSREVDDALAAELSETFLECVVAPSFSAAALERLASKKNLRLLAVGPRPAGAPARPGHVVRSVAGGLLVQSADHGVAAAVDAKVVTKRPPTAEELVGLDFAWRVAKHVKSNAIVYCTGTRTAAVGAGQMSRVDSARIAMRKAELPLAGSVAASDAFFPFRDGLDVVAEAGCTAVIQPGGSVRDAEVIAAADERGLAMLFTGVRHFRH
jgi:phosphoribosylaminoimidazolecarboxamide formyltransferase/IMP cyclohydrolase